jgi:hypothetical protein
LPDPELPDDLRRKMEEIVEDTVSMEDLGETMVAFGRVVASYYRTLVEGDIPENHALVLVSEWQSGWFSTMFAGILYGTSEGTEDEPEDEPEDE